MEKIKKYEKVAHHILELIDTNVLKANNRIPSIRSMARQMNFSIMTILEGYSLLENHGIVESRPQSGYYIRPRNLWHSYKGTRMPEVNTEPIKVYTDHVRVSSSIKQLLANAMRKDVIPLGAGCPSPEFFPSEELSKRMARIVRSKYNETNSYCLGSGYQDLKITLSRYMSTFGCIVSSKDIAITSGATQALLIALRTLTKPGDAVAVESPGYFGFYNLLNFLNLRAVEIPSNPQNGLSISALNELLVKGISFACILLSSNFCNPTGATMPDDAKHKLIDFCVKTDIPIIEDDVFGELAYNHIRPNPLKSLNNEQVIYISSMSKILAPGYRIGWIAGGKFHQDIEKSHYMGVNAVNSPCQLAINAYLSDGGITRHIRKLQNRYAENMKLFQERIASYFPKGTRTSNPQGGHFIWIKLPDNCDSQTVADISLKHNISIAPGIIFSSRNLYSNFIRLNCAVTWNDNIDNALQKLAEIINHNSG